MADQQHVERLAALARTRDGTVSSAEDAAQRARLLRAVAGATEGGRTRRWQPLVAAAALVVVVAAVVVSWPSQTLEVQVQGAELAAEGYLRAADAPATLTFSEGTTVTFATGSAGRLLEVTPSGARLMLERGHVTVDVAPVAEARWSLAAGPYVVSVTGTRFDLGWQPAEEVLELTMHAGTVSVRGPMVGQGLELTAGQQLVAWVARGDLKVGRATGEPGPVASATPSAAPGPSGAPVPTASGATSAAAAGPAPLSWSQLVAAGQFDQVLAAAEAHGIDGVLSSGSLDQVVALGDAARYRGRADLARRCLTTLRDRFGGSRAAKTAAFLLGRMSEGAPAAAIGWYDRYLTEDPGGAYAAEAMGRKLRLVARSDAAAARPLAKQYLAAYPKGAYAAFARQVLGR